MRIITSPTPKVTLPHQSMRASLRVPTSRSLRYAQTVPNTPIGTLIQNTARQSTSARMPPTTRPMNAPAMPAITLTPIAKPRCVGGERVGEDRGRVRGEQRAADALHDAPHDQPQRALDAGLTDTARARATHR